MRWLKFLGDRRSTGGDASEKSSGSIIPAESKALLDEGLKELHCPKAAIETEFRGAAGGHVILTLSVKFTTGALRLA
jgi:hypothetical protein